jgi:hypothetical protein
MKNSQPKRAKGYVSYLTVLSLGLILLVVTMAAYRSALGSQKAQRKVSLRIDYADKEDALLRAVVHMTPNHAIRAMRGGSDVAGTRETLRWSRLFSDALDQVNGRESVAPETLTQFELTGTFQGPAGDSEHADIAAVIGPVASDPGDGDLSAGTGAILAAGFPLPLDAAVSAVRERDRLYPIISRDKIYGDRAQPDAGLPVKDYPDFNLVAYPDIRFGYAEPGQPFLAKRNWWAFRMDLAAADHVVTGMESAAREFVVSLYEIPSQLPISAEAFAVLGEYRDGTAWQNANVEGAVYATRARVAPGAGLARISGRRGLAFDNTAAIGGFEPGADPFAPGTREAYEITNDGFFMPVSLASEAGRAAFLPISRGAEFFDRHAHAMETNTLSTTSWNKYSVGAIQCAMRLDITEVAGEFNSRPTALRFQYFKGGVRESMDIPLDNHPEAGLPPGYLFCGLEGETVDFSRTVDVAYGANGNYYFEETVIGPVTFDNARFGDPIVGTFKSGYFRPSYPFEVRLLNDTKWVVEVYPQRMKAFLALIGADGPEINHSLAVNVDYPGNPELSRPSIPPTELDYGAVLRECGNLTDFPGGFSLVTNLRLYIADDFNVVETTPPLDSGIPGPFYPPSSLFAPEKRYGAEITPNHLHIGGQLGNLAGDTGADGAKVHLLDMKSANGLDLAHDRVNVNLTQIRHPAALPPITMMNWLIVVEERRAAFQQN